MSAIVSTLSQIFANSHSYNSTKSYLACFAVNWASITASVLYLRHNVAEKETEPDTAIKLLGSVR